MQCVSTNVCMIKPLPRAICRGIELAYPDDTTYCRIRGVVVGLDAGLEGPGWRCHTNIYRKIHRAKPADIQVRWIYRGPVLRVPSFQTKLSP